MQSIRHLSKERYNESWTREQARRKAGVHVTKEEANKNYQIPMEILDEYEEWGWCGPVQQAMAPRQYDDRDVERLSLMMALHDIGLSAPEVERYMRLTLERAGTEQRRMDILNALREQTLDEIHLKEKQLERLDYLRYKLREQGAK